MAGLLVSSVGLRVLTEAVRSVGLGVLVLGAGVGFVVEGFVTVALSSSESSSESSSSEDSSSSSSSSSSSDSSSSSSSSESSSQATSSSAAGVDAVKKKLALGAPPAH